MCRYGSLSFATSDPLDHRPCAVSLFAFLRTDSPISASVPMPHDPDGMSGGSAFVIVDTPAGLTAYFAGIVVRGGLEFFHVIRAGYVLAFLNRFFKQAS